MNKLSRIILSFQSFLLKVAVASETRKVSNPKLPAILVVVETQWSVVKPTITSFVMAACPVAL
jgi:hypothetical protein